MSKHPFRLAIESGAGADDFRKLFAANAVIYAPILTKPVGGAREVLNIIAHAAKIAGPITYTLEVRDSRQTFLFWKGRAGGSTLEAVTILVDGEDVLRPAHVSVLRRTGSGASPRSAPRSSPVTLATRKYPWRGRRGGNREYGMRATAHLHHNSLQR